MSHSAYDIIQTSTLLLVGDSGVNFYLNLPSQWLVWSGEIAIGILGLLGRQKEGQIQNFIML